MKQLLVVAHDPSPNTRRLVEAVLDGARHEDIDNVVARHVRPLEVGGGQKVVRAAALPGRMAR